MSKSLIIRFLCISFIGGIALASYWEVPEVFKFLSLVAAVVLISVWWREGSICWLGFFIIFLLIAVFVFYSQVELSVNHVSQWNDLDQVTIEGLVADAPREKSSKTQLEIEVEKLDDQKVVGKILVTVPRYPEYFFKDKLQIRGKLMTPAVFEDFSYKDYLARFGIHSVMYNAKIEVLEKGGHTFWGSILLFKNRLLANLRQTLPEPESGFAQRLLLGERDAMSTQAQDFFKKTGTMHIVAISGYHVTIVSALLIFLTRGLGRRWSLLIALLVLVLYVFITGATASVVRAAIMGSLVLIALQLGRLSSLFNALCLAAVIMLSLNPLLLRYDIGFQLSFLAVLGIAYVSPGVEKVFQWLPNIFSFRDSVVITFSAMITTLPLSAYYFGRLSVISPLVNFAMLPSIPLAMGFSALVSFLGLISQFLAQIMAWPTWLVLHYAITVAKLGSQIPLAYFDMQKFHWAWLLVFYIVLFVLIFWGNYRSKIMQKK